MRVPTHRPPTHPGEMLLEEFLRPMEITQRELADSIHVPYQRINELTNGRRGMTPSTALRLAKYFGTFAPLLIRHSRKYEKLERCFMLSSWPGEVRRGFGRRAAKLGRNS